MPQVGKVAALGGFLWLFYEYRSLSWKYTYKQFVGKTMSYGNFTLLDHEPLSAEEIDKLKKESAARKLK